MPELRPLAPRHIPEAGRLLGRAFADNPGHVAALAALSPARRARVVEDLHRGFTAAAIAHWTAEGVFAGERLLGVMLVLGPGVYPPGLRAKFKSLRGALGAGLRGLINFARLDEHMQALHPSEPHHYLFILGVDPPEQGRGHGRTMLAALNGRADADRLPCYLETDKETSVRLYESAGYHVVTDDRIASVNNLRLWTMRRPPQLRL